MNTRRGAQSFPFAPIKVSTGWLAFLAILALALCPTTQAKTVEVGVQEGDGVPGGTPHFDPLFVEVQVGDTVKWVWNDGFPHAVVSGIAGKPDGIFDSGKHTQPYTYSFTFTEVGRFQYYCGVHFVGNDTNTWPAITVVASSPTPTPPPPSTAQVLNISTRLSVQTGDNVLIGGFIITGNESKPVILRALGPSLSHAGVGDALSDPVLELHGGDGSVIMTNDNWKDSQQSEIEATTIPPPDDLESAMVATLEPGTYTAVLSGKSQTVGVALVESYDLDQAGNAQLANISTRGLVGTESNVMIGGFIVGGESGTANILLRALGPSLAQSGISGALADPTIELHDVNGALLQSNDDWKETEQAEIEAIGIPPTDDREAAIFITVASGAYTAIVAGKNATTGVGLVEVYRFP